MRGALAGVLALVGLQVLIGTPGSAQRVTGFAGELAKAVQRATDPNVPAIRDRRGRDVATAGPAPSAYAPTRPPLAAAPSRSV